MSMCLGALQSRSESQVKALQVMAESGKVVNRISRLSSCHHYAAALWYAGIFKRVRELPAGSVRAQNGYVGYKAYTWCIPD